MITLHAWSAFHASQVTEITKPPAGVHLLPLFYENAHLPSMMLHGMHVVRKIVEYLNPGQTPVINADQPLFALMKQLQWELPNYVGEDKCVVFQGGLHLEIATVNDLSNARLHKIQLDEFIKTRFCHEDRKAITDIIKKKYKPLLIKISKSSKMKNLK